MLLLAIYNAKVKCTTAHRILCGVWSWWCDEFHSCPFLPSSAMVFGNKLGSPLLLHFVHSLEMHGSTLGQDELIQFQALNVIFLTKKMRDN